MRCKAKTLAGRQCRNSAVYKSEFCNIHRDARAVVNEDEYEEDVQSSESSLYCSFCGKSQHDVTKLIAGPGVFICDECTDLCIDILWEDDAYKKDGYMVSLKEKIGKVPNNEINLESLGIKPRFNKLKFARKEKHCFYLCPFSDPYNTIYDDHIRPVLTNMGFSVERADEVFGTQPIVEDIWESINSSEFVIADVTGKNPNVMYEIGMAHTVGKPVVIITQSIDDVPFDLKHYRCLIYEYTPKGVKELEEKLTGTMRFLKSAS